jgi:hypothetical protein
MATEREVGEVLAVAMPLFANYKPPSNDAASAMLTRAWLTVVGHLPVAILRAAMLDAVTRTEFFPTPKLVLDCATALQAPALPRSGLDAWGDVVAAIAKHGYYHPPAGGALTFTAGNYEWDFDDPIVGRLVASLGWAYLCHSEDAMADRAHFVKAYEQMRDRAHEEQKQLPGVRAAREQIAAGQALALVGTVTARLSGRGERG